MKRLLDLRAGGDERRVLYVVAALITVARYLISN